MTILNKNWNKVVAHNKGMVILLLLLYLASVIQVESLHSLFHSHDQVVLHSQEQEKDPCHRAVHHGEKHNDSSHKSHVEKSSKCSFCAPSLSTLHIGDNDPIEKRFNHTTCYFVYEGIASETSICNQRPSRAPPIV